MFPKRICCSLLVVLLTAALLFVGCHREEKEAKIIYLEEPRPHTYPGSYDLAIQQYPSSLTVEPITDYTDAAQKGQQLWDAVLQGYGYRPTKDPVNPGEYVEVFYVSQDDTWVIMGTSPDYDKEERGWAGILPMVIIKTDGTVLSVGWV